jgi:hypothetical protein
VHLPGIFVQRVVHVRARGHHRVSDDPAGGGDRGEGGGELGGVLVDGGEGAEQGEGEDPGVPEETAAVEEFAGAGGVGLFDEAAGVEERGRAAVEGLFGALDVAVAGVRGGRLDAEGDDLLGGGGVGDGGAQGSIEAAGVADVVIGGQGEDHGAV